MSTLTDQRIEPSDLSGDELRQLEKLVDGGARPVLQGRAGETIELPPALNDMFAAILAAMKNKQAVFLMHEDEAFTTQAAASFLGVSRQYFVRLLEEGKMPFHRVGTHRRVFFKDLVEYQQVRTRVRAATLDKMTKDLVEAGVYDRYAPPESEDTER